MVGGDDHSAVIRHKAKSGDLRPEEEHQERSQEGLEEGICHGSNLGVQSRVVTPSERGRARKFRIFYPSWRKSGSSDDSWLHWVAGNG